MPRAEHDNRPARYVEETDDGRNRVVYRASALSLCPSAFAALALGHQPSPPPPKMQKAFDEGHEAEPMILAELEKGEKRDAYDNQYSIALADSQVSVELVIYEDDEKVVVIRGTIDDFGYVSRIGDGKHGLGFSERRAVVEAKNFGMSYLSKFLRHGVSGFPSYEWQTSVYGYGMAKTAKGEKFCPVLFAVRSKDTERILVQWIDEPIKTMKQIRAHVLGLEELCEEAIESGELPKCDNPTYPCPVWKLHDIAIEMPEATMDLEIGEDDPEYVDYQTAIDDWCDAKIDEEKLSKKAKTAAEWRKTCGEVLRTMLEDRNVDPTKDGGVKIRVGACVVSWSETTVDAHMVKESTRTTFNVKVDI